MDKVKFLLIFGSVLLIGGLSIYSYDSIRLSQQESFEYNRIMLAGVLLPPASQINAVIYRLSMEQLYPFLNVQLSYLLFFQIPSIISYLGIMSVGIAIILIFYRRHRKTLS
jgi:hypothetical protein